MPETTASFAAPAQTLEGPWVLAPDAGNVGEQQRWFDAPTPGAQPAPVPGIIQQVFPDTHGVAWYWHRFRPARLPAAHQRALLRFGAVDYQATVWVNGVPAGGHEGGETPFALDVTGMLRPGENLLAVRVLNPTDEPIDGIRLAETPHRNKAVAGYRPGMSYNHGGILLPVELALVPAVRIEDVFARPRVETGQIEVQVTVRNDTDRPACGPLLLQAGPDRTGDVQVCLASRIAAPPRTSRHTFTLAVSQPRRWDLDDPFLYRVRVSLDGLRGDGPDAYFHARSVRCGFRDFRVADGWFVLNGRRVFLKSTHTGNHFPIGQMVPHNPDFLRRDLLYARACGFNTVRFIAGVALPEQLYCCDEIGLMVYEECYAGWCLEDSPRMAERFDFSVREMVLRDRNHPSVSLWGLLNETRDGPVFRHAVEALGLVRALDDSRLVLLGSGRWDCRPEIGSVCNPGSTVWEHQWGVEAPSPPAVSNAWDGHHGGYFDRAGDAHVYPATPLPRATYAFLRSLGQDTKPIFLSEFGTGSLFNAAEEYRRYDEVGAAPALPDRAYIAGMLERLQADWARFGMEETYPFLDDFFRDSYRLHVRQRLLNFDLVRGNPRICGYNLTGMLDHALTGEGLWTFWREWKPGIADALRDGWAPLRWCLLAAPWHGYAGRPFRLEAVLANEDVLPPGEYPATFRVQGPLGPVWEQRATLRIPPAPAGGRPPLAVPVLDEDVVLDGPAGRYLFAARLDRGGAPLGGRAPLLVSDAGTLPRLHGRAALWGIPPAVEQWLSQHGLDTCPFPEVQAGGPDLLLVGEPPAGPESAPAWEALVRRVEQGSVAVFLSPRAFRLGDDSTHWLPLEQKGRCVDFHDWLYHKECVAKAHPVFEGLQAAGIMDWDFYEEVIPHALFEGQETPDEVAAAAFAVGYSCPGGYASGVLVGAYRKGRGALVLNTLRVLEGVGRHPAADRLLLNLVRYARQRRLCADTRTGA